MSGRTPPVKRSGSRRFDTAGRWHDEKARVRLAGDALGFFMSTAWLEGTAVTPGVYIATPDALPTGPQSRLVGRVATTHDGETFSFDPWTLLLSRPADECEITIPTTFGPNGSDVVMYPFGEEPEPMPLDPDLIGAVDNGEVQYWSSRRFPWLESPSDQPRPSIFASGSVSSASGRASRSWTTAARRPPANAGGSASRTRGRVPNFGRPFRD